MRRFLRMMVGAGLGLLLTIAARVILDNTEVMGLLPTAVGVGGIIGLCWPDSTDNR